MFRSTRTRKALGLAVVVTGLLAGSLGTVALATSDDDTARGSNASLDAAANGPGLSLTAPATAQPESPFAVTVGTDGVDDAAAFETVVRFDGVTLADATAGDARVLTVPQDDGVAIGVLPCDGCELTDLTLQFVGAEPARARIGLDSILVVDQDGAPVEAEAPPVVEVEVGPQDGRSGAGALGQATWTVDGGNDTVDHATLDVTGDDRASAIDLTEVVKAWTEGRTSGDPCELDPTTALADTNGDGCADIGDLQAMSRAIEVQSVASGTGDVETDGSEGAEGTETDEVQGIRGGVAAPTTPRSGASLTGTVSPASIAQTPPPTTYVVDVTHDGVDNNVSDGLCITTAGGCSLRAAITQSNAVQGGNRIEFAIPGNGPHTIQLESRLPTINDTSGPLVIDGYSQPGSSVNTDPLVSNAEIEIQVRGTGVGTGNSAFVIASANNTIRGLSIYNSFYGIEALDTLANGNKIVGNIIGLDASGNNGASPNFSLAAGVWLFDGPKNNRIGTPALEDRNVISGNRTVGVKIEQSRATDNIVQNNIIGMNPSATAARPNNAGFDLQWFSKRTTIGGTGVNERNLISGNAYTAIDLSHTTNGNSVVGNYIGTWADGRSATSTTGNGDGILLKDNAHTNDIAHNVISGNDNNGIWGKHNYTDANTIRDNLIGVGIDGSPVPNRDWGIWLTGESDLITRNVIAHNDDGGIYVNNSNGGSSTYPAERTRENEITNNSFYGNGGLAIDIEPVGPNPNDPGDLDEGTHDLLNFPEVTSTTEGNLTGTACVGCSVELYVADNGTDSHGEGRQLIGTQLTDAGGSFSFADSRITGTRPFTLLAIDPVGNTSEFSERVSVAGRTPITPSQLTGAFSYSTINGVQVATTPDRDVRNDGGPSNTSNTVRFDFSVPAAGTYQIQGDVYTPSGSSNSFWVQLDGAPSGGIYWSAPVQSGVHRQPIIQNGSSTPYPFSLSAGSHTLTLSMREDGTGIASIVVIGPIGNNPPVIPDPGAQAATTGTPVSLDIGATDADADVLTHFATDLPSGLSIDSGTGVVSGTPNQAGTFDSTVHVTDGKVTVIRTVEWTVVQADQGPVFTDPGPQSDLDGDEISLAIVAVDPDDDPITFSATGLPTGLDIDPDTGVVSGRIQGTGFFQPTITATDGANPTTLPMTWLVSQAAFACFVDADAGTLSWTNQNASAYYIRHIFNGTDTYLGSSDTLTFPITATWGTYKVTKTSNGTAVTTCDAPDAGPPAFTCQVDAQTGTLSWNDQNASTYYVRHIFNGTDTYLGSSNTLTFPITATWGTYKVTELTGTTTFTTCDGPDAGPPAFTCQVDAQTGTLSWNDQNASTYYIRHIHDGTDTYLGSSNTLTFPITATWGTYKVTETTGATTFTTCDGPDAGPPAFTCQVDAQTGTLSWTDQGASTYYIRHMLEGSDTYLGSSDTLEYTISTPDGTYKVTYIDSGQQVFTTCQMTP